MSTKNTYYFTSPECGTLELEIDNPFKQIYNSILPEEIPFKIQGLLNPSTIPIEPICFFEWQTINYSYLIEDVGTFKPPFELRINDRREKESKLRNGGSHLLNGYFIFENEIGETKVEIRDKENTLIFLLETEVFPQKMDYKSDYKAMMAEISGIIHNLAIDAFKDTFKKSRAKITGQSTIHEWWNILDALFDALILNLGVIKRHPKHEIRIREQSLPIEKVIYASNRNIPWFNKNIKFSNDIGIGINITKDKYFTHALAVKKYVTYDTYENRFIAWAIRNIIEKLRKYKRYTEKTVKVEDYNQLLSKLKKYQGILQGILHENPFNEVGEFEKRSHFSTSLTRGTGYRDFIQIYLILSRGLDLSDNDIFKIEQKNISTLYEYWCFLKLVMLIKEQTGNKMDYQNLIKIKQNKISVELKSGLESKVVFKKQSLKEETAIYFNREFTKNSRKVYTYNQRPDYTVKFTKNGFDQPFWYLFDAKYRFDEIRNIDNSDKYENSEERLEFDCSKFIYNVPQEAIGQLHRYRDAILHTEPINATYRAAIKNLGGIILYPYPLPEEKFKIENPYYKSLDDVNIGAMPFLPSKTELVSNWLNNLINKKIPEEHYEQFIEMDRSEYQQKRDLWKEWVTIGTIEKKYQEDRIKFLTDNSIYHTRFVLNSNSKLYMSKKILVCISGTKDAYLCEVGSWEILSAKELQSKGTTWPHKHDKYISFNLNKLDKITTPQKLSSLNFRYATLEGLNRYLRKPDIDKYCFYLTNPDAARLFEELRKQEIDFKLEWGNKTNDPSEVIFVIKGNKIKSSDLYPNLSYKFENTKMHLNSVINFSKSLSNLTPILDDTTSNSV